MATHRHCTFRSPSILEILRCQGQLSVQRTHPLRVYVMNVMGIEKVVPALDIVSAHLLSAKPGSLALS